MSLLDLRRVTMRFGGLTAVKDLDFSVEQGGIASIIGPNGAGKTTVFNVVTGVYEPTEGTLHFEGRDLRRPVTMRAILGIAVVAAGAGAFTALMVHLEPLWDAAITAHYTYRQSFPWGASVRSFFTYLVAHAGSAGVAFLVGAVVGGAGAVVVWTRQRRIPHVIAEQGICRTFQNLRLFPSMTVMENVVTGMDLHLGTRLWDMLFRTPRFRAEERSARERAMELLAFVGLADRAQDEARSLPYGAQRRLEIARALATRPRLLLLDEPAAGMNPSETSDLMKLIERIRDSGVTVLLIEHHMKVVMGISDRIAVLNYGVKICEGTPAQVRADPAVVEAYLGKEDLGVTSEPLLRLSNVRAGYGPIEVLKGVSLEVHAGEIVTLIGANGAGKTTTLMCISGVNRARAGSIVMDGHDLTRLPTHRIMRLGIAQAPEGRKIFPRLSVVENLEMGAFARNDKDGIRKDLERAFDLFPILRERRGQAGGTLSGGEQQMLAIARALMGRPRLLLLDEPSLGLAPLIVLKIFEVIRDLHKEGISILLVEQNARLALRLANRGYVLETGELLMQGDAKALLEDPRVQEAYLGEG